MRFFVYEFVTGGGWWSVDARQLPNDSLFRQGLAMLQALVGDLAQIGAVDVMRDARIAVSIPGAEIHAVASIAEERRRFSDLAQRADWTIVIAPEFDRHLATRCEWVGECRGQLLSPNLPFVSIASDKHRTVELLARAGIRVPRGCLVSGQSPPVQELTFPSILKPCDGAGSSEVHLVTTWPAALSLTRPGRDYRLEEFCSGSPASVSVIAGSEQSVVLPASSQQLSEDGRFEYRGGSTPLSEDLCRRAARLARGVVDAMPPTSGYFGIDLIFGSDHNGTGDVVIEVNPRLTTSYLGPRKIAHQNLAQAMLRAAQGEVVELSFDLRPVQFSACNGLASTSAART